MTVWTLALEIHLPPHPFMVGACNLRGQWPSQVLPVACIVYDFLRLSMYTLASRISRKNDSIA